METKRAKVIMLPTEDKTDIICNGVHSRLQYKGESNKHWTYQHLYITTDEEIKEGDWFLFYRDKWHIMNELPNGNFRKEVYGKTVCKIIATTDKLCIKDNGGPWYEDDYSPQIPQSFIKQYCDAGGIDGVLIELMDISKLPYNDPRIPLWKNTPKVDSHNEIIIHPIKDNYSRGEMEVKIKDFIQFYTKRPEGSKTLGGVGQWVKENL